MASPTRWTWVWVNSGSWWWTERPSVLQFMGSQRIRHHWATELNWTEQLCNIRLKTSKGALFLPPLDVYVRSFLYLFYTLIKLYYTRLWTIKPRPWPQIEFFSSEGQESRHLSWLSNNPSIGAWQSLDLFLKGSGESEVGRRRNWGTNDTIRPAV